MTQPDNIDTFSLQQAEVTDCPVLPSPVSLDMEAAAQCLETILKYNFKNKRLVEEALTHSSYIDADSYERLEFIGDKALELGISSYMFLIYPKLQQKQLSELRAANVNNNKLARVALKHGFHRFLRHNSPALEDQIRKFAEAVSQEQNTMEESKVPAEQKVLAEPKVLADIVESIAAAVFVDNGYDLQKFWMIFGTLLEPIVSLEDLEKYPQPVTMLYHLCQKHGKKVDIKHQTKNRISTVSIFVDNNFVASSSSKQKGIAKINAAREALDKLSSHMSMNDELFEIFYDIDDKSDIVEAKKKLHEFCSKKKWPKPIYKLEKEEGPSHDKKFVSSVEITTPDGKLYITGDEKSRVKNAENSASSIMIRALYESSIFLE